jgi:hypothetical protein
MKVAIQTWLLWVLFIGGRCRGVFSTDRGVGLLGQKVQDQILGAKVHRRRGQCRRSPKPLTQDLCLSIFLHHSSICPESRRPAELPEHVGHGVSPGLRNVRSSTTMQKTRTKSESEKMTLVINNFIFVFAFFHLNFLFYIYVSLIFIN